MPVWWCTHSASLMFHDTFAMVPESVALPSCCFMNRSSFSAWGDKPSLGGAGARVLKLMLYSDLLKTPVGPFTVCEGTNRMYSVFICNGGTVIFSSPFNAGLRLVTDCPLSVIWREVPKVIFTSNHSEISVVPSNTSVSPLAGLLNIRIGGLPSGSLTPFSVQEPADNRLTNSKYRLTCKMTFCII